jgi:hypothetical protein
MSMVDKIQVLNVVTQTGESNGRKWKRHNLQVFGGGIVGTIPEYEQTPDDPTPQPGYYMAHIGWNNYQGRFEPRIINLAPIASEKQPQPSQK